MQEKEIIEIFSEINAYQTGHFLLSSGLHSGSYLQCALVLQDPIIASRLCAPLAERFKDKAPDLIIGPAMGGVVLAYEIARHLNARAIFTERNAEGKMTLRRGFRAIPANRILIAEDVLTTGGSVREVISLLAEDGMEPVGIISLVDRSGGTLDFGGIKYESLLKLNVPTFRPEECPLCKEGLPLVKPGSRKSAK
ncbi:MAG: orotate phosphoribosyltransferase [Candidatus Omnitrophica bacterium]|nr:orotate phosphoribosyltransferase [Candidatus Omnitrophota bacterium]MDD5488340.1 orotate phosphoribosyltransferase [Candidatus Omnitrophota bacterium]